MDRHLYSSIRYAETDIGTVIIRNISFAQSLGSLVGFDAMRVGFQHFLQMSFRFFQCIKQFRIAVGGKNNIKILGRQRMPFYHFDVYRIGSDDEMDEIGYYEAIDGDGVCLIEWAELIYDILPPQYKKVTIKKDVEKGFDYRTITVEEITR